MAEITGRRRGELVRGVFEVLMDKPDPDRRRLPLKPVYFLASTPE